MPERLPEHYDPNAVEQTVKDHWNDPDAYEGTDFDPASSETTHAYEYVKRTREDGEPFYFLDGPPFTSGRMHVGNAWGKVLKDVLLRYHRMQGHDVRARPGYDTHGLPVEVNLERRHGFETKDAVEAYGVDRFVDECRAYVDDQRDVMTDEFRDLAVWMDWDDPYQTMDPGYVDVVWNAFATLYGEGLVERGERVVNTCPRCETAVSDSRLEYEERTVEAAYVGFPLTDREGTLVTWTTTPWTVVGNQFVAVDGDATYAAVDVSDSRADRPAAGGDVLWVAADRVAETMDALGVSDDGYAVRESLTGAEMVGWTYDHPLASDLPDHPDPRGAVTTAPYVDVEKTGLVHSAPGFGHEDFERARELDRAGELEPTGERENAGGLDDAGEFDGHHDPERALDPYSPVGLDGRFTGEAGPFAGQRVHGDGRDAVLAALREAGALLGAEAHVHEYPQCPRCDADVVYRTAEQWLVGVTELKGDLLDALEATTWYPADARDERFRNTVENAPDWNVSRQRYWGTPLPVWVCRDCDADVVVSSRERLADLAGLDSFSDDPHRPTVDDVTVACPECGGPAERVADVLDVWFDSAVASWASLGERPGETPVPAEWPADLVVEGNDQTRGWFLVQLVLGVALAGRAPYDEVLMHGWALLDGEPMSKSRGHVLRPPDVAAEHGRDALRAHLLSHDQQGRDVSMTSDVQGVETVRERLDVVWNVVRFAAMFMAEDDHVPTLDLDPGTLERDVGAATGGRGAVLDRWVLTRLREVTETATAAFEARAPDEALAAVLDFLVEDVSRFYVQTVRERVWTPASTADKLAAYDVLGTVLHACVRLLAPFVPHLAERLYGALDGRGTGEPTVHATGWPDAAALGLPADDDIVAAVETLREVESAVATARQRLGRKQRWPVREVVVETEDAAVREALETHRDLFADRVNAETVTVAERYEGRERVVDPDMAALGPLAREDAQAVADAVRGRPASEIPRTVTVDGTDYAVTGGHVSVVGELPDDVTSASFDRGRVYVDGTLSPTLRRQGLARDVARRVQELRADLDLDVDERVGLWVDADDAELERAVRERESWLLEQVRATGFVDDPPAETRTWSVDGETVELGVSRDASGGRDAGRETV